MGRLRKTILWQSLVVAVATLVACLGLGWLADPARHNLPLLALGIYMLIPLYLISAMFTLFANSKNEDDGVPASISNILWTASAGLFAPIFACGLLEQNYKNELLTPRAKR